jgi:hypothetical protein
MRTYGSPVASVGYPRGPRQPTHYLTLNVTLVLSSGIAIDKGTLIFQVFGSHILFSCLLLGIYYRCSSTSEIDFFRSAELQQHIYAKRANQHPLNSRVKPKFGCLKIEESSRTINDVQTITSPRVSESFTIDTKENLEL